MTGVVVLRVLPPDVYDTLEFSALAYGGIGHSWDIDRARLPCCVHGQAMAAEGIDFYGDSTYYSAIQRALYAVHIGRYSNDKAVHTVLERRPRKSQRITFKEWVKELNVVRGEEPPA